MTSCHISLVKLKQYLSPFLCIISPCVPQKHATTFNRITFLQFLPPSPFIFFYNSIFSNTGILEFMDFLQCTAKPEVLGGFYPLKTLFESEKNGNWTILYLLPPSSPLPSMNCILLWEISLLGGGGVLIAKRSGQNQGWEKADKAQCLQRWRAPAGTVLALTLGKPGFQFQLYLLSLWPWASGETFPVPHWLTHTVGIILSRAVGSITLIPDF